MAGAIATDLGYCQQMRKEYMEIANEAGCGPRRRHAMLRVYQYEHRIALLKAGTPRDQLRNLEGDCPIRLRDLDPNGNIIAD